MWGNGYYKHLQVSAQLFVTGGDGQKQVPTQLPLQVNMGCEAAAAPPLSSCCAFLFRLATVLFFNSSFLIFFFMGNRFYAKPEKLFWCERTGTDHKSGHPNDSGGVGQIRMVGGQAGYIDPGANPPLIICFAERSRLATVLFFN